MLTDTEVADTARHLLASELAPVSPPASLLTDVRARHASAQHRRRASAGLLATVTAAGLTAGLAGSGLLAASPARQAGQAAQRPQHVASAQTIVLDGYPIRVASPLSLTVRGHGDLTATLAGRKIPLSLELASGSLPAGAARVRSWQRPAYLLRTGHRLSLYLPFPVPQGYHSVVVSSAGLSEAELLRFAAAITVAGQPGFLRSMPPSSHPAAHCPCG